MYGEEDRVGGGVIDWSLSCCHYFQRLMARKTILEAVEANHGHHRGRGEAKERGHWGG